MISTILLFAMAARADALVCECDFALSELLDPMLAPLGLKPPICLDGKCDLGTLPRGVVALCAHFVSDDRRMNNMKYCGAGMSLEPHNVTISAINVVAKSYHCDTDMCDAKPAVVEVAPAPVSADETVMKTVDRAATMLLPAETLPPLDLKELPTDGLTEAPNVDGRLPSIDTATILSGKEALKDSVDKLAEQFSSTLGSIPSADDLRQAMTDGQNLIEGKMAEIAGGTTEFPTPIVETVAPAVAKAAVGDTIKDAGSTFGKEVKSFFTRSSAAKPSVMSCLVATVTLALAVAA